MKKLKFILPLVILVLIIAAGAWYVNDYYHSEVSVETYSENGGVVKVVEINEGLFLDGSGERDAVIFYPGAKVEYTAYLPLFYALAEQGVDCFLVKMPFNLAFLGMNKADDIMAAYDYEHWYLAGHSLGGAMAASYASGHLDALDGLILLAAYPTKDLKAEDFRVLSVYGSEDGVVNRDKLMDGRQWMPDAADAYTELCIEGGNHAWFGNYGEQKGDGKATITRKMQQSQTVEAILKMLEGCVDEGL